MKVVVIGAGAWGTATAIHAAREHSCLLFARDQQQADAMRASGGNKKYLPDAWFPKNLAVADSIKQCVEYAGSDGLIVVASPVAGLRETFQKLSEFSAPVAPLVWLSKGLEAGSGELPHQIASQVFSEQQAYGVLSGPSFAQEVAAGLPVALVVAGNQDVISERCEQAFHHNKMRVYFSSDMTGVELGGAMKNVVAIAAGICDGLQLGANARAALITRGLAEIARLGQAFGARPETFMGLAGMGDLVLTCATDLSRNRRVGLRLATGESLQDIVTSLGHVAEGVPCAAEAVRRAQSFGIDMPIAMAVNDVIRGALSPKDAVADLLSREAIAE